MEQKYGDQSNNLSGQNNTNQQSQANSNNNQPGIFDKFDNNKNQATTNQSPNSLVNDNHT